MKTLHGLDALQSASRPIVLAIGFFDGVHRGHLRILRSAIARATQCGGEAWALTFDPHPAKVLLPNRAPLLLTSHLHKLRLIEQAGMEGCVVMNFTPEFASQSPHDFLGRLQEHIPTLRAVVVGVNWKFGRNRSGNAQFLEQEAVRHGWEAVVVEPELCGGEPISSTRIRDAVGRGQMDLAREMLGRRFSILGTVVPGKKVGRALGYPTVNLDPHNEVRPPPGIYAVWTYWKDRRYKGAAFLADPPHAMEGPSGFLLEVHLLDFHEDVYGEDLEVVFVQWIREAKKFEVLDDLKRQIARDVADTRRILANDDVTD